MKNSDNGNSLHSDDRLAVMAQQGDLDAEETLMRKYKETVRKKSKMYYMAGADEDDIVQEGMIGSAESHQAVRRSQGGTFRHLCQPLHNEADNKRHKDGGKRQA